MKNFILSILLTGCGIQLMAQDRPVDLPLQAQIFRNFHGLVNGMGEYIFEGQGYSMKIVPIAQSATRRAIDSIANTKTRKPRGFLGRLIDGQSSYEILRRVDHHFIDSTLPLPNSVVGSINYYTEQLKQTERSYIMRTREDEILDILLIKSNEPDSIFLHQLLRSIYFDGMPKFVVTPYQAIDFDFIDRKIDLYPPGLWQEGHNLAAGGDQLNWSMHDNYPDALEETKFQMRLNKLRFDNREQLQDTIDVVFEGTPTRATRIIYKLPWYGYEPGTSRELIVYYITTEVRGRYVHCVLSHYNHDIPEKALSSKVIPKLMRLKNDSSAAALYKTIKTVSPVQDYWNASESYFHYQWSLGIWQPIGNLSKAIGTSPAFYTTWALRIAKQWKLDGTASFFVPVNATRFPYQLPDTILFAKPNSLSLALGGGATHANRLGGKWFLDQTIGVGYSVINTDQKKPKLRADQNDYYHTLPSIDFSMGLTVRKFIKSGNFIGLNVTWHHTPFTMFKDDHVDKSFGSHALTMGFTWGMK